MYNLINGLNEKKKKILNKLFKKSGVSIPTSSKINKDTGEIINPTRQDIDEYNKRYKTIKFKK